MNFYKSHPLQVLYISLLLSLLCACSHRTAPTEAPTHFPAPTPSATAPDLSSTVLEPIIQSLSSAQSDISEVIEKISPAVVGLRVQHNSNGFEEGGTGLGTGFFVHPDGYLVTNHHVAGNAQLVEAVFEDGHSEEVKILWSDDSVDLAIGKIDSAPPAYLRMGSTADLKVGNTVVAIGTPLSLQFQHTVTSGIISALNRTLSVPSNDTLYFMEELIQIDASINPGNSGGPLCNLNGEVIGINTLKLTAAEGIGFAIPIDLVSPIVEHIVRSGSYSTPYIGISMIDAEIARYFGESIESGIYVVSVDGNGPAGMLGMSRSSCIHSLDGEAVDTLLELRKRLYTYQPGDTLEITWSFRGEVHTDSITLSEKPV